MLNFIIFKIIVLVGIVVIFLAGLLDMRKKVKSILANDNVKNIKDISLKVNLYYLEVFFSFIILGILISLFIIFSSNPLMEFAINFCMVTDNYYEEVDKQELLKKAFNTVMVELDDDYTEVVGDEFIEHLKDNISTEYGYKIYFENDNVYISEIEDASIEEQGLKSGDRLICVNNKDIKRVKLRRSTRYIL